MAMEDREQWTRGAGDEAGSAAEEPASRRGRRYSASEKRALLEELSRTDETQEAFCARRGVSTASMSAWKRAVRERGEAGLEPVESRRNPSGKSGRWRSPEERRAAVEAFERSQMTLQDFARTYGVSPWTLRAWRTRYRAEGPRGLEPRPRGRKPGSVGSLRQISQVVRDEIARTKSRFPEFGLKKVRDFLRRFQEISVSTGTVARTLRERGLERVITAKKRRRAPERARSFERARPGELWQSDITSFVLSRSGQRVYLVAFLDDHSRYLVSFGLHVAMRSATVIEALLEGTARYGKPREVLTDQGPQYFAWRGKSSFQKLLAREGIRHVVARSHHPQTLGKCERLWETIGREFWDRARPADLSDGRDRLSHFLAHYNFFRPHQGIEGAVPADRFFGAQNALRKTLEGQLSRHELEAAVEEAPRRSVYLFGQIGDEQVSVVGERGELLVQTSSGVRQRMGLEELGAPSRAQEQKRDGNAGAEQRDGDQGVEAGQQQKTAELQPSQAHGARSEGAVDERHGGATSAGAPCVHPDFHAVAGQEASRGSGRGAGDPAPAAVATQPAGALGDAGRAPASTSPATSHPGDDDGRHRRPAQAEEASGGEGQADRGPTGPDPALVEHPQTRERTVGRGGADPGQENAGAQSATQA
jgi:transposase InsO family protein